MKILFIITQSEIGGAQRFLLEFAPYLANKGYQISIAAGGGDGELFEKLESSIKCPIYKIKNLVRSLNPISDFLALISILKVIKREKPDVLFLQSTKAGFLGSIAGKLLQKRVLYRIGGWSFRDPRSWWMNKIIFWMEKISAPLKDKIIVNSELDKQLAVDRKIAQPDKIVKIYNGIDPNALSFLSKEEARKRFPLNGSLVGTIANLYATKGIEYLIGAARVLPGVQFVVIGEGKERERLEYLTKKYNLENFSLSGRIINASEYLKAFDIFVLPSIKEGFPWVLLEAMAAEVPIVATSVGAVPEIIEDGEEGLLVSPKDSEALAEKITRIIESPTLSQKITENASKKLKHFSQEKMLRESENIINDQ